MGLPSDARYSRCQYHVKRLQCTRVRYVVGYRREGARAAACAPSIVSIRETAINVNVIK